MDKTQTEKFITDAWHKEGGVIQHLKDYISIPNASPMFDAEWHSNGLQERVVDLFTTWAKAQAIASLKVEVVRLEGRTPLIFCEVNSTIPGETYEESLANTLLLYGHFDKQPPLTSEWTPPFQPYTPLIHNNRLYGRGGADDGYAIFAALTSIAALEAQGLPHARCVLFVEGCEESGSYDLPFYIEHLSGRIGTPSLIICLDSGTGNYEQLWLTTSLRGIAAGTLTVKILEEGVHSGTASGVVPSSFRIMRQLFSRIEDQETGKVLIPEFWTEIPDARIVQSQITADALGHSVFDEIKLVPGAKTVQGSVQQLLLNRSWRPAISVTGVGGLPPLETAGNVLRSFTSFKISVRTPPTINPQVAAAALKHALEINPPYGAQVTFTIEKTSPGWNSPALVPWLEASLKNASETFFDGKPACLIGEGGSIPFMGLLGEKFPRALFAITGLLGPGSNAHGPNEFLDIPYSERLTGAVASLIYDHHKAPK